MRRHLACRPYGAYVDGLRDYAAGTGGHGHVHLPLMSDILVGFAWDLCRKVG